MKFKNRVGEVSCSTKGQLMTIIAYRSCNDIDIQFEDGTCVYHKQYNKFIDGNINNPTLTLRKEKSSLSDVRLGETNFNRKKELMMIVDYVRSTNITVMFEDGTEKPGITYDSFRKGRVKKPILV